MYYDRFVIGGTGGRRGGWRLITPTLPASAKLGQQPMFQLPHTPHTDVAYHTLLRVYVN